MAEDGLAEVVSQLRISNALLCENLRRQFKLSQADLIEVLGSTGASTPQIAAILGTSENTVKVARFRQRKKRRA